MPWIVDAGDKDNLYDIRIWLEVLDAYHESWNDWPFYLDIPVFVTDWYDCEVVDNSLTITTSFGEEEVYNPGPGTMPYGEDAHINAEIHCDET